MLWFKALHLIFMVTWFAGLFYLPRLFVYHAACNDAPGLARFKVMERKLYIIMTIGAVLTLIFGIGVLISGGYLNGPLPLWLKFKLPLLAVLGVYHWHCGTVVNKFKDDANSHSHVFYRWYNEAPAIFLVAIVILAVLRPT